MAEEVRINLTSSADTSGVDKMGAAVGGISGGAEKAAAGLGAAAKGSKELGSALGKSVEVGGAATSLMTNLATASQGGASGFFAAGRAILSFGQIVKGVLLGAGPVGIAVAAIGLLAGAVFALKDAFRPAGESVEEFKKRIENLDKANLRALDATLAALSDRLKATKEEADAVRASLDKIDDAEMAAKLSAVKSSALTPQQKEEQEFLIRDEFKQRRTGRERQALEDTAAGAAERREAIAPEFQDARDAYGSKLNELDRINSTAREVQKLMDEVIRLRNEASGPLDPKMMESRRVLDRARSLDSTLPSKSEAAKFDVEFESARNRFQGADGKGGIAAEYQKSVQEADKASRALSRFNDTIAKVGEWEKAQVRIERGGIDPRDTEAAARQSPGRNRLVGADGSVVEYDSSTVPTINQQIAATTNAMRLGGGALPQSQAGGGNQLTFGALQPGSDNKQGGGNQLTFGALQPGSDNKQGGVTDALKGTTEATQEADTGDATAAAAEALQKAAEEHAKAVKDSAQKTDSAIGSAKQALSAASGVLTQHNGKLSQHDAELRKIWGSISALRSAKS